MTEQKKTDLKREVLDLAVTGAVIGGVVLAAKWVYDNKVKK